jgi:Tol biopolymer transport system component/tRNA A-37 threonylcarbamoyl transferase component Bud32
MGEVYRARDPRLGREVAIKALPAELARDEQRLARFRREAQLLAALNHPNVAAIHGLEEADGQPFLVLELVPGEDLAARLKRGALPLDEALAIAEQVASALEEAHEKGIVHRDLKPANVKVTPDGKVKVLDFGLAKAWSGEAASGDSSDLSQSPTLAHTGTAAGIILGTAGYMSPEQARGRAADKRSDVWAFGVLLFEMLTGRRLFEGETVSDTLAAVLRSEPEWTALPGSTPPHVRRLLRRCLERDARRRLRDIGEARIALTTPPETAPDEGKAGSGRRGWSWPAAATAALAVAALAFAAGYTLRRPTPPPAPLVGPGTVVRQLTFEPGLETDPSFSPDGNYVAYTTDERGSLDIVVAPVAGGTVRRLVETDKDEAQPAWSPDGTQVAFTRARDADGRLKTTGGLSALSPFVQGEGGEVFLVPAAGGTPVRLVERGAYPAWSPDGRTIAFQSDHGGHRDIWTVPAAGGEPRRLTDDDALDYQPAWSPDGRWVAYASDGLRVVRSDGSGPPRTLSLPVQGVLAPAWSVDGRWLYFSASRSREESWTSLWRLAFGDGQGEGPLERITLGELADVDPAVAPVGGRVAYGRVAYSPDLWELDLRSGALRQITSTTCLEDYPHLSPDGRTLAFHSDRSGQTGLFTIGVDGRGLQPVTGPDVVATMPRWSPDGRTLAFVRRATATWSIAVRPVDGLTVRDLATVPAPQSLQGPQWSPDGRRLAFSRMEPGGRYSIRVVDLEGAEREVVAPGGLSLFPAWSPDGRRVAFQREKDGPRQIWVAPEEGGEARAVSTGTAELSHPQWSPKDPDRVLVVVDHRNLALLSVARGTLEPLTRFHESTRHVDYPAWSADGTKVHFSMTLKTGDVFLLENRVNAE